MTTTKTKLIESTTETGVYDISSTMAIIEHPQHGRLLICDGYGGEGTLQGGTYRWKHGVVCKIKPTDTLPSLEHEDWNEGTTALDAVLHGCDDTRPVLDWHGQAIAAIAKQAGI